MKTIQKNFFLYTAMGCGVFVVLTLIAMLVYPGGSHSNLAQPGYSFSTNFFSDLGLRTARNGQPNPAAGALFFIALTLAGLTLALFFIQFRRFFLDTRRDQMLSLVGALLGVGAGISFIGVAFTPADVSLAAHILFVTWAFRLFPLAVLCFTLVMFNTTNLPRGYAYVFLGFFGLLVAYYLLLIQGPGFETPRGLVIQALGQKIIVYASLVSILIVSLGAWRMREGNGKRILHR
jgi:hypothetical membrane protein